MYDLSIEGHMSELELLHIEKWASEVPENGVIMEVGSLYGRSAYAWAKSCHPSVNVYCVDTFYDIGTGRDFYPEFCENTKDIPNITSISTVCPYFSYSRYVDKLADIFFVDARHINPNDWEIIKFGLANLKPGGLLCGHDYHENFPDVIENVDRLEHLLGKKASLHSSTLLWSFVV